MQGQSQYEVLARFLTEEATQAIRHIEELRDSLPVQVKRLIDDLNTAQDYYRQHIYESTKELQAKSQSTTALLVDSREELARQRVEIDGLTGRSIALKLEAAETHLTKTTARLSVEGATAAVQLALGPVVQEVKDLLASARVAMEEDAERRVTTARRQFWVNLAWSAGVVFASAVGAVWVSRLVG